MASIDELTAAFVNKPDDSLPREMPDYIRNRIPPKLEVEPNTEAWDKWIEDEADCVGEPWPAHESSDDRLAKLEEVIEAYNDGNHTLEEVADMIPPALPQGVTDANGNIMQPGFQAMPIKEGYGQLARIFAFAYDQCANGKGTQRHGGDALGGYPVWDHQPIIGIARMVGPGGPAFQAIKKLQESIGMHARGEHDAAMKEALGAIVYAAAVYYAYEEAKFHTTFGR